MRRVIVVAAAGLALAGCSSFSMDSFQSAAPPVTVQIESIPPGAEAKTSAGPGCKTPCSVQVPPQDFTVTFTLPKFQTTTVPVSVVNNPGDITSPPSTVVDPSPVVAELQPATPARRAPAKARKRPAAQPPAAPAAAGSPFPPPPAASR